MAKTKSQPKTFAECKTDEERAEYLETHDVIASGEFADIGSAQPQKRNQEETNSGL